MSKKSELIDVYAKKYYESDMRVEKEFDPVPPMSSYALFKAQLEPCAPIQKEFYAKVRALIEEEGVNHD